jgi:hypothetical protein
VDYTYTNKRASWKQRVERAVIHELNEHPQIGGLNLGSVASCVNKQQQQKNEKR